MLADLREQFGAIAADLFGRMLRVQERFEQLWNARITVHRMSPAGDLLYVL